MEVEFFLWVNIFIGTVDMDILGLLLSFIVDELCLLVY
jgi:hypothetical protein